MLASFKYMTIFTCSLLDFYLHPPAFASAEDSLFSFYWYCQESQSSWCQTLTGLIATLGVFNPKRWLFSLTFLISDFKQWNRKIHSTKTWQYSDQNHTNTCYSFIRRSIFGGKKLPSTGTCVKGRKDLKVLEKIGPSHHVVIFSIWLMFPNFFQKSFRYQPKIRNTAH